MGSAGRIIPISDPEAAAGAYVEYLSDGGKWLAASMTAMERVKKYYSMERFLGNYEKIYREMGGNGRNSV